MSKTLKVLKVFEYLWLLVALLCLILGIRELARGEGLNHYFLITIVLAILGLWMHRVKKQGRKSTEKYYSENKSPRQTEDKSENETAVEKKAEEKH